MPQSDIDLVLLVKATGDDNAFAELVRRHQAKLRAFLRRLSNDYEAVDDIAQTSFLKAHRAIADFRSGGSFRSWLFAIAYREFLQAKRRDAAHERIKDAAVQNLSDVEPAAPENELSIDLKAALSQLPENERAALLLCDAVGFTHAEAATAIGAPLGSVKSWVLRGRAKMRDLMAPPKPNDNHVETTSPRGVSYAR